MIRSLVSFVIFTNFGKISGIHISLLIVCSVQINYSIVYFLLDNKSSMVNNVPEIDDSIIIRSSKVYQDCSILGYWVQLSDTVISIWFLYAKQFYRQVSRQVDHRLTALLVLLVYIALAADLQVVDYFYILVLLQMCMFQDSGLTYKASQIGMIARCCSIYYLVVCLPTT